MRTPATFVGALTVGVARLSCDPWDTLTSVSADPTLSPFASTHWARMIMVPVPNAPNVTGPPGITGTIGDVSTVPDDDGSAVSATTDCTSRGVSPDSSCVHWFRIDSGYSTVPPPTVSTRRVYVAPIVNTPSHPVKSVDAPGVNAFVLCASHASIRYVPPYLCCINARVCRVAS